MFVRVIFRINAALSFSFQILMGTLPRSMPVSNSWYERTCFCEPFAEHCASVWHQTYATQPLFEAILTNFCSHRSGVLRASERWDTYGIHAEIKFVFKSSVLHHSMVQFLTSGCEKKHCSSAWRPCSVFSVVICLSTERLARSLRFNSYRN